MHYNLNIILFQIISGQFRLVLFSFVQFRPVLVSLINKPTAKNIVELFKHEKK